MHAKYQNKKSGNIHQAEQLTIRKEISYIGLPPKPNLSCMNWFHKFHYFGIIEIVSMLIKVVKNEKIIKNQIKSQDVYLNEKWQHVY